MPNSRFLIALFGSITTVATLSLPTLTQADQVTVPVGQQASRGAMPLPTHGMTQMQVEERFGAPEQRRAAVGDPPISRWEYADYVVYFERDRVLRAVVKSDPGTTRAASDG